MTTRSQPETEQPTFPLLLETNQPNLPHLTEPRRRLVSALLLPFTFPLQDRFRSELAARRAVSDQSPFTSPTSQSNGTPLPFQHLYRSRAGNPTSSSSRQAQPDATSCSSSRDPDDSLPFREVGRDCRNRRRSSWRDGRRDRSGVGGRRSEGGSRSSWTSRGCRRRRGGGMVRREGRLVERYPTDGAA